MQDLYIPVQKGSKNAFRLHQLKMRKAKKGGAVGVGGEWVGL